MVYTLFLFLPPLACFFWALVIAMTSFRTSSFWTSVLLLFLTGAYLVTDAFYVAPNVPYSILMVMAMVAQVAAPSVIPVALLHFRSLRGQENKKISYYLWVFIPVVLFTAGILLTDLSGQPNIEKFLRALYAEGNSVVESYKGTPVRAYFVWTVWVYRGIVLAELIMLLVYLIRMIVKEKFSFAHVRSFLSDGGKMPIYELQTDLLILTFLVFPVKGLMFKDVIDKFPWISMIFSVFLTVVIFLFAFTCMFGGRKDVTLSQIRSVMRFNYNSENKAEILEEMVDELLEDSEMDALKRIQDKIEGSLERVEVVKSERVANTVADSLFSAKANSWDDDGLLSRFQSLMLHEKLFLQSGLTLVDVAEKLNSNKTYVSRMVNSTYNLGFPELINTLRVDYAEEYILSHRNAKQEEIAAASGFVSASSFNNTFKKVTGVTPRVWMAGNRR